MNSEFIHMFDPFSIILTTLNYKFKTNAQLTQCDLENIKLLKIVIPIFNRVKNEEDLDLNQTYEKVIPSAPMLTIDTDSYGKKW